MTLAARPRRSAIAGLFYPAEAGPLGHQIESLGADAGPATPCIGLIVPHAPYDRAGAVMVGTLASTILPRRCLIVGPNHTGLGSAWSVMADGGYDTPLGEVEIDDGLAEMVRRATADIEMDEQAHAGEHAIEALLPILRALSPETRVVPLITRSRDVRAGCRIAEALAAALQELDEPVLVIASAEFTQFESEAETVRKDAALSRTLEAVDVAAFERTLRETQASICGAAAVACVMELARRLGATRGERVRHATSAAAGGDPESATGYLGMRFR